MLSNWVGFACGFAPYGSKFQDDMQSEDVAKLCLAVQWRLPLGRSRIGSTCVLCLAYPYARHSSTVGHYHVHWPGHVHAAFSGMDHHPES